MKEKCVKFTKKIMQESKVGMEEKDEKLIKNVYVEILFFL